MSEETKILTGGAQIPMRCPRCGTENPPITAQGKTMSTLVVEIDFLVFFCGAPIYAAGADRELPREPVSYCGCIWSCSPTSIKPVAGMRL